MRRAGLLSRFATIGEAIRSAWERFGYGEDAFPSVASRHLESLHLPTGVLQSLALDAYAGLLPVQATFGSDFGQPPVTVFWHPRFFIDILVWNAGTTSIHDHAFSGAFAVLQGSSLHTQYEFRVSENLGPHFKLGNLELGTVELLQVGDSRQIHAGSSFIHAVFHLDLPTISIVVRTAGSSLATGQWSYHPPFIARQVAFADPEATRLRELLVVLADEDTALYRRLSEKAVASKPWHIAIGVLEDAVRRGDDVDAERLLQVCGNRYPGIGERFSEVLSEMTRVKYVARLRESVRDPDLRYFLGLVANVRTREWIMDLIRARYPGDDPFAVLETTLGQLTEMRIIRAEESVLAAVCRGENSSSTETCAILSVLRADPRKV